jgi:hypothetical protein
MKVSALVLPFAMLAACHYDWGVGPRPVDDSGSPDGAIADAAGEEASIADASGSETQGSQCDVLEAEVGLARPGIIHCQKTCGQSVFDECGCEIAVEDASSKGVMDYAAAVKAYKDAGCHTASCPSSCDVPRHECVTLNQIDLCS